MAVKMYVYFLWVDGVESGITQYLTPHQALVRNNRFSKRGINKQWKKR